MRQLSGPNGYNKLINQYNHQILYLYFQRLFLYFHSLFLSITFLMRKLWLDCLCPVVAGTLLDIYVYLFTVLTYVGPYSLRGGGGVKSPEQICAQITLCHHQHQHTHYSTLICVLYSYTVGTYM